MSEDVEHAVRHETESDFAIGFQEMYYVVVSDRDHFDVTAFLGFMGRPLSDYDSSSVAVASIDPEAGKYHVLFSWMIDPRTVEFRIEYYAGPLAHTPGEQEPFAEQFMEWFRQFFKEDSASCHVHARFEYPLSARRSRLPLPQQTELPYNALLTGASLRLENEPNGVASVRVSQSKATWYTEVVADRTLRFGGFKPQADVAPLYAVLATFLEEVRA